MQRYGALCSDIGELLDKTMQKIKDSQKMHESRILAAEQVLSHKTRDTLDRTEQQLNPVRTWLLPFLLLAVATAGVAVLAMRKYRKLLGGDLLWNKKDRRS